MATGTDHAPAILWFRRDLRLADNPALAAAVASGRPVIPLYIDDPRLADRPAGAASRWWLDGSLRALAADLKARGAPLILRRGDSEAELRCLIAETGARAVYLNRLFEPAAWTRNADIAHGLKTDGVEVKGFNASLLSIPGSILNGSGGPYRVFTPFLKALLATSEPPSLGPAPDRIPSVAAFPPGDRIDTWALRPSNPDWATGFAGWSPGERGALARLSAFVDRGLDGYRVRRDRPGDLEGTSRLSPHLHFGEISPWRAVAAVQEAAPGPDANAFIAELAWRDDLAGLKAWRRGLTGYPIVDAGMRQLWRTGWMHNRVRMIVASFLVKDLLIDWREGAAWFEDTLVDADLANNSQNWQWVGGSGADAAPYFRVFNPVTQGEKFDADGAYVRKWVPELAALPDRWLHAPWTAPAETLAAAGVELGRGYPRPIVDHAAARRRALDALAGVNRSRDDELDGTWSSEGD